MSIFIASHHRCSAENKWHKSCRCSVPRWDQQWWNKYNPPLNVSIICMPEDYLSETDSSTRTRCSLCSEWNLQPLTFGWQRKMKKRNLIHFLILFNSILYGDTFFSKTCPGHRKMNIVAYQLVLAFSSQLVACWPPEKVMLNRIYDNKNHRGTGWYQILHHLQLIGTSEAEWVRRGFSIGTMLSSYKYHHWVIY